ncbi:hypothetical protein AB0M95_01985 [Sphaerisporangium sp. NPDC051017]|uniref:hypothetical protein n=1 Tax=Sphaerisporangium sp. NPDC051017 TaxID=3154636 RepID=UPI0034185004
MTRRRPPTRARLDVQCWQHGKRLLLVEIDIRDTTAVHATAPKHGDLDHVTGPLPVACPRGCADVVNLDELVAALRERAEHYRRPFILPWPAAMPVT